MCGRYASTRSPAALAEEFGAVDATGTGAPGQDFNVAPTKNVLSVVQRHPRDESGEPDRSRVERSLRVMRWGLVPHWAKDPAMGSRMINARAETVADKPAFRTSLRSRRCLLPADGWYEWKGEAGRKQPYFMTPSDGSSLALAGIWAVWRDPRAESGAPPWVTCSVVTTSAVGRLAEIHPRMPLVLSGAAWPQWLDPDVDEVADLLAPPAGLDELLELRPVSKAVNKVSNNGAELVERVPEETVPAEGSPVGLDRADGESG